MGLLEQIKAAGIVGCGGAGFPAHAKLDCQVEYLIINAAECEPLLRTDRYLMKHRPLDILSAAEAVGELTGASYMYIGLKDTYTEEILSLQNAIEKSGSKVRLYPLHNYYPAGDEQLLVCDVTGRTVPPGGIPLNVGAVVSNVASMIGISDAMKEIPFTDKYLTVTGAVRNSVIVKAPLGTSLMSCIEAAGGLTVTDYHILVGGPMMGKLYSAEEAKELYVTKTTSGIVAVPSGSPLVRNKTLPVEKALKQAKTSCVQCQTCTSMCPRHLIGHTLEPHKIMRALAYSGDLQQTMQSSVVKEALTCSECGLCEVYACPMGLSPRKVNQFLKQEYRKAGVRYQKLKEEYHAQDIRSCRRVNSKRLAMRLGVDDYYDYKIDSLTELHPSRVTISAAQHIGAPGEIIVKTGDVVQKGTLLAKIPENALGANIHCSIDGRVTNIDGHNITVEHS